MRKGPILRAVVLAVLGTSLVLSGPAAAAAPVNDDLASATLVPGLPFTDQQDTTTATLEAGEPTPSCASPWISNSVWYRFDAVAAQAIDVNTIGTTFNSVIAVYRGADLAGLTEVACNDNRGPGLDIQSEAFFQAVLGETYSIQVAGIAGRAGEMHFEIEVQDPVPPPCAGCPVLATYPVPPTFSFAHSAGETSIGVNLKTDRAMFQMLTRTLRISWDDSVSPPAATWENVTSPFSRTTADPILWTDQTTGRTFVVQLVAAGAQGVVAGVGSVISFTDDDGETWIPTEPGIVLPSWDHQTIGGGPYPAPLANPVYPNQLFYCAQLAIAQCARSDDGGLTWGAPFSTNVFGCGGLHGHVTGGPDGTVYLPIKRCSAAGEQRQGVVVSTNGGVTWEARTVPGSVAARSDPKVAFDKAGRMYFVAASNGKPVVVTSDDGGRTWSSLVDVGAPFGIRNAEFPMVIAGDAGRAAFAFYGTTLGGNDQSDTFTGAWHAYVAYTYDGGATWQTVNATPGDPIQRGCIWLQGGSNPCRNLLDFQDMSVDSHGRVLVGLADGCTSNACIGPNGTPADSRDSLGVVARQTSGRGLAAAYDPPA